MAVTVGSSYSVAEKFQACVDIIHNLPKTGPVPKTYAEMLSMYALYKQATLGQCTQAQPAFWNLIERYKWDAWKALGDISKQEAMERYVIGVLEKIDYCAEKFDWDEMLQRYSEDYERLEPLLREKFRIIERELIKEDGSREMTSSQDTPSALKTVPTEGGGEGVGESLSVDIPSESMDDLLDREDPAEETGVVLTGPVDDPLSDAEYCDARDDAGSLSRSSSFSLHDHSVSPSRIRTLRAYCARMDVELRTISSTLSQLAGAMEGRHASVLKLLKSSAVYIAVPSRLSWRAILFFLLWPFIVHGFLKWLNGNNIF